MRRKNALPELLAPAGSFEALVAAVKAGADAVYVGGKSFGARAFAKNFDTEELERAAVYCRLFGVKLYVTINTLVYDREEAEFADYVRAVAKIAPDAVIAADLGAISIIRSLAPALEIHASTQMSLHNAAGLEAAARLGCKRAVLARELSFSDIIAVTEKSPIETEIFIHGALCVCHSGQCLMSSLVGGRSGNRGECAQPCRLPYNNKYPLSLRDLSLAAHIPEIIDSGVASLKIEGRMKSPEYVYTVTSIYRRLLDEKRRATEEEHRELARAFSRGGFTDAYFTGKKDSSMTGIRSEEDKRNSAMLCAAEFKPEKKSISAKGVFRLGKPSVLTLTLNGKSVTVLGDTPTEAKTRPLDENSLKERIAKMGNTFFSLPVSDIEIELDEGINLSPAAINALRREAVAKLEERASYQNGELSPPPEKKLGKVKNTAQFFDTDTLLSVSEESLSNFDIIFAPLYDFPRVQELAAGVALPPVVMEAEWESFRHALVQAKECGAKYALVANISEIDAVREAGLIPIGDFRLNVTNRRTRAEYEKLGVSEFILSPEITLSMARDIGGGEIVLGRIPLMITERCFVKENFGCDKCGAASFTDRTGAKFPIIKDSSHRNLILNSKITYMGDKKSELDSAGIGIRHFLFTNESPSEIKKLIKQYKKGESVDGARRIGKR